MILQALVKYYEDLERQEKLPKQGWCQAKVSYGINLSADGDIKNILWLKEERQAGKKQIWISQTMKVPAMLTRSSGVAANFLCDNSKYMLGIDKSGTGKRITECFEAAKEKHLKLLKNTSGEMAQAICAFFYKWNPEKAKENAAVLENWEEITDGGNLIFCMDKKYAQDSMQVDADKIKIASEKLKHTLGLIQTCESKAQLRGFEGEAASVYFGVFDEMILQQKKDFSFQGRNKRPPLDNMNAMLSFVYTLLTNTIASSLECVGLDPYVGYLHTERPGRVSLALDMIEELRAVLADRFVLSLVNKKIVNGKNFTKKENGAVLMDDELRKKLLVEWQKKKKETITHPFLKEKVEWGMVPYVQAMLLARYLRGDLDSYPVFLWK